MRAESNWIFVHAAYESLSATFLVETELRKNAVYPLQYGTVKRVVWNCQRILGAVIAALRFPDVARCLQHEN